jgi:hypothetical protein
MGLCAPSECIEPRAAAPPPPLSGSVRRCGSSHEVSLPFSVSPLTAAASWPGLPHPTACALRFSQPLDAFRSTASLPALFHAGSAHGVAPSRALLPPRGRTPSPAPIPSWCWSPLVTISTSRSRSHPGRPKSPRAGRLPPFHQSRNPAEPSCRRPSRRSRSPAEPTGRPTLERRSALRARQWRHSPSAEAPFEPSGHPTLGCRSTVAPSRARLF